MEYMKNFSQYEKSEAISKNFFVRFGKILFIFALIFPIAQIMHYGLLFPQLGNGDKLNTSFSLFVQISYVILLLLLVLNARKIKLNYRHNKNIKLFKLFYIGLFLYLIRYLDFLCATVYNIFIKNFDLNAFTVILIILNLPLINFFVEVITWYSLRSFFRNLKDQASLRIRKNENNDWKNAFNSATYLIIIVIMQILPILVYSFLNIDPGMRPISQAAADQIAIIFNYIFIILFTIGYFILSISLMQKKISVKEERYYNDSGNGNLEDNNISALQKKFCGYCGHPIQKLMEFCPECGNSLSP